jgi:hypothetical protein
MLQRGIRIVITLLAETLMLRIPCGHSKTLEGLPALAAAVVKGRSVLPPRAVVFPAEDVTVVAVLPEDFAVVAHRVHPDMGGALRPGMVGVLPEVAAGAANETR